MMDRFRPGLPPVASAKGGFTFVELLLFTGIISIMAGSLIGFALVAVNISVHNEVVAEVEQNGDIVLHRITYTARGGGRIAYPLSGKAGNELLLTSGNPKKEILFHLHGGRMAMVENGVPSYLTTDDVLLDSLSFLHFGTPETTEGVSVVFRAANAAIANQVRANQYVKVFRATALLPPGGCVQNGECTVSPFTSCCEGLCRPNCGSCTSHSDCGTNLVCCIEGGAATCKAPASCATPQCLDVADCPNTAPSCDLPNCNYHVPTCAGNSCTTLIAGPCPSCSLCGDARFDPLKSEECDDGDSNNTNGCTSRCRFARCNDGAIQPLGKNGVPGGGDDEQCDDGNRNDDDGCSMTCQNESLCSGGSPNGTQSGDEECDDGNGIQTDTCDSYCRRTVCGDGIIQTPNSRNQTEQCDDGNTLAGDLCSPSCLIVTANECGNGILEAGEECDDGMRCTATGNPCRFDADCPGASNFCRGMNIDGCTTPSNCTVTQNPESTCSDGVDNDCDALVDCADSANCPNGTSCGVGRTCQSGACQSSGGWALIFSDTFTDTDSTTLPAHNVLWQTVGTNAITVNNNQAKGVETEAYAYLNTALNNNQAVEVNVTTGNNDQTLLYVRSNSSLQNGYQVAWNGLVPNTLILNELTAGVGTTLGSTTVTWNANDLLRLEADGNQIRVFINGMVKLATTDSIHSSGRAGLGIISASPGTADNFSVYQK